MFKTGLSAFHEYRKGTRPVEFVFLGGNSGHQSFKACIVAKRELEAVSKVKIAFVPLWSTDTVIEENGTSSVKDISIWRIIELESAEKAKEPPQQEQKTAPLDTKQAVPAQQGS